MVLCCSSATLSFHLLISSEVFELLLLLVHLRHLFLRYNGDDRLLAGKCGIEVLDVKHVLGELWLHGGLNLLLKDFVFVEAVEPGVSEHFFEAGLGAQALGGVFLEELIGLGVNSLTWEMKSWHSLLI